MTTYLKSRSAVVFRAATKADAGILLRLVQRYYAFDQISFDAKAVRSGIRILLKSPSAVRAFLVLHGSKPVGYAILTYSFDLEFGGPVGIVTDLYLEGLYRGAGIGRKTMQFLERVCRKEGVKALELLVERKNTRAFFFYERRGFRAYDRILMSKHLRRSE